MKLSWSRLQELQAEVPHPSSGNFAPADPRELLARAEEHQAALEELQQTLGSLEQRVQRLLISSSPQEPPSPGAVGETLVKIRQSLRRCESPHIWVRLTPSEMLKVLLPTVWQRGTGWC